MQKILIYPYNKRYEPVVKFQKLIVGGCISGLVSPRGWGLGEETVDTVSKKYSIKSDFSEELNFCDIVWFVEDGILTLPESLLQEKLEQAILKEKKIIYTRYVNGQEYQKMNNMIPKHLNFTPQKAGELQINGDGAYLWLEQKTPVIFVSGTSPHTDKYAMQLAVIQEMRKRGYRVSAITSRRDSEVQACHSIPDFMWDTTLTSEERILRYNHFVKLLELQENPDVIVIGIPGGVIPYSRENNNHYGIMAFEIFHAITSDSGILCSLYEPRGTQYLREVEKLISERYGVEVNYHHVANMSIDSSAFLGAFNTSYLTVDREYVHRQLMEQGDRDVYNMYDDSDIIKLVNCIEKQL